MPGALVLRLRGACRRRVGRRPAPALRGPAWPRRCRVCNDWQLQGVCGACVARFAAPRPRCMRCAIPAPTDGGALANDRQSVNPLPWQCADCRADPPAFDRTLVLADYGFPWSALIAALKYQEQPELAASLGQALAARIAPSLIASNPDAADPPDWLLPVPISRTRLIERGYNQSWELAKTVARRLNLPTRPDVLRRHQDAPHQVGAGRLERQRNLAGAFTLNPAARSSLVGARVAIVDDVVTTGATAQAAALALRRGGAAEVQVWAVARTA